MDQNTQLLSECINQLDEAKTDLLCVGDGLATTFQMEWKSSMEAVITAVQKVQQLLVRYKGLNQ